MLHVDDDGFDDDDCDGSGVIFADSVSAAGPCGVAPDAAACCSAVRSSSGCICSVARCILDPGSRCRFFSGESPKPWGGLTKGTDEAASDWTFGGLTSSGSSSSIGVLGASDAPLAVVAGAASCEKTAAVSLPGAAAAGAPFFPGKAEPQ